MSIDYRGGFNFAALRQAIADALPDALEAGGDHIADVADTRVPVLTDLEKANDRRRADPGELKRSRYVRTEGASVAVGYSSYWAKWQHERLDYHHEVGQAKYLESAFNEGGDEALQKVAKRIREGL
jgi:hypothetical protein